MSDRHDYRVYVDDELFLPVSPDGEAQRLPFLVERSDGQWAWQPTAALNDPWAVGAGWVYPTFDAAKWAAHGPLRLLRLLDKVVVVGAGESNE